MAPQQHLVISWVLANLNFEKKRDRIVAMLAGVLPDLDGIGIIIDRITGDALFLSYQKWHRTFGHNIFTLIAIIVITFLICERKLRPALVASLIWLVHMLFDLTGSAGPDNSIWPLIPFWPLNDYELSFSWQWALNDWKNVAITAVFVLIMLRIAITKRRSLLEIFSTRFDQYAISICERIILRKKAETTNLQ